MADRPPLSPPPPPPSGRAKPVDLFSFVNGVAVGLLGAGLVYAMGEFLAKACHG